MASQIILNSNNKEYIFNIDDDSLLVNSFASSKKFAKTDTYDASTAKYKSSTIQTALNNNKLSNIAALDGLFIDWDNVQVTINDQTYNINSTADLLNIIENASKTATTLSDSNLPIRSSVVKQEFSDLEAAIANLAYVAAENMSNLD